MLTLGVFSEKQGLATLAMSCQVQHQKKQHRVNQAPAREERCICQSGQQNEENEPG